MGKRIFIIVAASAMTIAFTAAAADLHASSHGAPRMSDDHPGSVVPPSGSTGTPTSPGRVPPPPATTRPVPRIPPPIAVQDGPRLSVILRSGGGRSLHTGDRQCATLSRPAAVDRRLCVTGGPHPVVREVVGSRSMAAPDASVERLGPRAVRVSVDSGTLQLGRGATYRVQDSLTRAGTRPTDSDAVSFRWRTWQITGCHATGPARIFRGSGANRQVGLSFDDGPSGYTDSILSLLRENGVHATFFVIGVNIPTRTGVLRHILADGDMIGDHSLHHEMPAQVPGIAETQRRIRDATGFTPCNFRPPGGVYTSALGSGVTGLGMRSIFWSIDTRDWTRPGTGRIVHAALQAHAGDIILMHDGGGPRDETVNAVQTVLRGLRERGLTPVPVEELLGETPLYRYGP